MKFINNRSHLIMYLVHYYNAESTMVGSDWETLAAGVQGYTFTAGNATHMVGWVGDEASSSPNTYFIPKVNGITLPCYPNKETALANGVVVEGQLTFECDEQAEASSTAQYWCVRLKATSNVQGKTYQLNEHPVRPDADDNTVLEVAATMSADNCTITLPYQYRHRSVENLLLAGRNSDFMFGHVATGCLNEGSPVEYGKAFVHNICDYYDDTRIGPQDQWMIYEKDRHNHYTVTECSAPQITIIGGKDVNAYGLWDWLETNGTVISENPPKAMFNFDIDTVKTLGLTPGTHTVSIQSNAEGYEPSQPSQEIDYLEGDKHIPEGATYTVWATGETLTAGMPFPETPGEHDLYRYGNYEYAYNCYIEESMGGGLWFPGMEEEIPYDWTIGGDGWGVRCIADVTEPGPICEYVGNRYVTTMFKAFVETPSVQIAPEIPSHVRDIEHAFADLYDLVQGPSTIPSNVIWAEYAFSGCSSLKVAPQIPSNLGIIYVQGMFYGCSSLEVAPILPEDVEYASSVFNGCTALKTYHGSPDGDGDFSNYELPKYLIVVDSMFSNCESIIKAPAIPSNVESLQYTFAECTSLEGNITINTDNINTTDEDWRYDFDYNSCYECFSGVDMSNITLSGEASTGVLNMIGSTGNNWTNL